MVFRNTETMDYIGKLLKQTETGRKLTKSERFSRFETKLKQVLEKVKILGPISGVSKHWNNGLYRGIIETDWNMKKIEKVRTFQSFRNKIETSSEKGENTRGLFQSFETSETIEPFGLSKFSEVYFSI